MATTTDTTDFLNKLSNLGNLPNNAILVTLDMPSLYTNNPHNQGIDACRHFLDTRPNKHIPTETLCDNKWYNMVRSFRFSL